MNNLCKVNLPYPKRKNESKKMLSKIRSCKKHVVFKQTLIQLLRFRHNFQRLSFCFYFFFAFFEQKGKFKKSQNDANTLKKSDILRSFQKF